MPSKKKCTLRHIQDVLCKRKKVLLSSQCCHKKVPKWPELSVKECYDKITTGCPQVLEYLPTPTGKVPQLPEREFFWTVVYTVCHDAVKDYIEIVDAERRKKPNLQDKKTKMLVSEEYMDELLKYDFQSTKKGRAMSSILIRDMNKKRVR